MSADADDCDAKASVEGLMNFIGGFPLVPRI